MFSVNRKKLNERTNTSSSVCTWIIVAAKRKGTVISIDHFNFRASNSIYR